MSRKRKSETKLEQQRPIGQQRKRGNKLDKQRRIDQAITLLSRGARPHQVVSALMQSEGLQRRQAERYVEKAEKIRAGLGSMATEEERGLLFERINDLYGLNMLSDKPDLRLANEINRTHINLHGIHVKNPKLKGGDLGAHHPSPSNQGLSAGLEAALRRFEEEGSTEGSSDY